MIVLDAPTIQFCASVARHAATGIPSTRPQHDVASATLKALAEELEAMLPRKEGRNERN